MENASSKRKICIIEDDEFIQETYRLKLEQEGYEVLSAFNGEEGFELISAQLPDLVLIDLNMPKVNGVELMKMMLEDQRLKKILVIVLTNYDSDSSMASVKGLQSSFYLVKSMYTPAKVAQVVKEVLH